MNVDVGVVKGAVAAVGEQVAQCRHALGVGVVGVLEDAAISSKLVRTAAAR
jgi:hypothetical protein